MTNLNTIADILNMTTDLQVSVEYPGYLRIATDLPGHLEWHFGTANGMWDGELCDPATGEYAGAFLTTGLQADETDLPLIARLIAAALLK